MDENERGTNAVLDKTPETDASPPIAHTTRPIAARYTTPPRSDAGWWGPASPFVIPLIAFLVMGSLLGFGVGVTAMTKGGYNSASSSSSSSSSMGMANSSNTDTSNVPVATQTTGGQPAKFVVDADGAKHFTLTAKQVMWEPIKDTPQLAWTIDGTIPGPMLRVTAGDHLRITLINHFPQSTSLHLHGLSVPSSMDGVPGVGQKAIQPDGRFTYDFTVQDQDAGTHWYHSHDNDLTQEPGGFYGAFIVDPRPGSPEANQVIHADVEYTDFISEFGSYFTINGKSYPDTQPIMLKHGQTVHLRLIGASEMSHPMHLHGGSFSIVAEDGHMLSQPLQKDTILVSPGETYDLTFYGWAAPGSVYPFHCHILSHVMNPGQTGDEMGGLLQLIEYSK